MTGERRFSIIRERPRVRRPAVTRLHARLAEAEATLKAIRNSEVDALVVEDAFGCQIFTLLSADHGYQMLVESMQEGAAALSPDGVILYCNRQMAVMLATPLEQVTGAPLLRFVPADKAGAFADLIQSARQGSAKGEITLMDAAGRRIPVHLSISRVANGPETALCLLATDLTEHYRNAKLVADGQLADSILDQATEAVMVCDHSGRIIRASRIARDLCECDPVGLDFLTAYSLRLNDDLGETASGLDEIRKALWHEEGAQRLHAQLARPKGEKVDLMVSVAPLWADGRSIGRIITCVDVTQIKQLQRSVQAQARRLQILADAAVAFSTARSDKAQTAKAVARYVSESFGDGCVVRLLSDAGELRPAATWHPDPEVAVQLWEVENADLNLMGHQANTSEHGTSQPLLIPVVPPELVEEYAVPYRVPFFERFGLHSRLLVPLRVGSREIGTLGIVRQYPDRPYTADDLQLLQELADRAAMAITNAQFDHQIQRDQQDRDER